jgi:hypothetical protein
MKLSPEAERIEGLISEAFATQCLGDGVGMREADAYDDHAQPETVAAARSLDERDRWQNLDLGDVRRYCEFGWCFLDAAGLAFHLPAMLRAEIHEEGDDFFAIRMGNPGKQRDILWDALTRQQRLVVREFLIWAAENSPLESDREDFMRGLSEFWTMERIEQASQAVGCDDRPPTIGIHTSFTPPDSL